MKNNAMEQAESNAYILGTERTELHRLGLQHQVWAAEARRGWELGGFRTGHTLLDLGCGPGFCTLEMAYLAGQTGRVIGVDLSANYITFLKQQANLHGLAIDVQNCSFDDMELQPGSLDGAYSRWALAWVPNPEQVLAKVRNALKPGGRFVVQEYFNWSVFQTEPPLPHFKTALAGCYRSMREQPGDIDVGRLVPAMGERLGMKVLHTRVIAKTARPNELTWEWPRSFLKIYVPKLAERGFLTNDEATAALADVDALSGMNHAVILCPVVLETVLEK
ncbi:MAG: methyltransferase domain-containing protein [Saprospiraceae bacterium]